MTIIVVVVVAVVVILYFLSEIKEVSSHHFPFGFI